MPSRGKSSRLQNLSAQIVELAEHEYATLPENVRLLIMAITAYFREFLIDAGYPNRKVQALITKFRDAGRRSAPWRPASGRVPGRPQDGADGNRRLRWLFPRDHKFYADEVSATLVEVKYFLQTLSMSDAPPLPDHSIQSSFNWLLGHDIIPGQYLDPIQLVPIALPEFLATPTLVQSGHLVPLDRGGRHVPENTFLMLARSNQLQGNLTRDELIRLMAEILERHRQRGFQ